MNSLSFPNLSVNNNGLVYITQPEIVDKIPTPRALRLCTYKGQNLLAVGRPDDVYFYDATEIIQGLHKGAAEFDLPMPAPLKVDVLDHFTSEDQAFISGWVLGADNAYLKTLVSAGDPDRITAELRALDFVVNGAAAVRPLESALREKAAAEIRDRLAVEKSRDILGDYTVPLDRELAARESSVGVVGRCPPAVYARISRDAGGYSPASMRTKWLFNTMQIGDDLTIDAKLAERAQTAVHVYAKRTGKRFKTTTNRVTRTLYIVRVEDRDR